jgi:TRAP-type C4-dicarboxylate transport system permease small subunit
MIKRFDNFLHEFSKWGVTICVVFMLTLTILNIVLRWFEVSILWIEPLVRHLVFLGAFFGGSLATGERHHIKIDILSRLLEKFDKKVLLEWVEIFLTLVTLTATIVILIGSIDLSKIEFEFGKHSFLDIHSGYLVSIIPAGMALISLRLVMRFLILSTKRIKEWN